MLQQLDCCCVLWKTAISFSRVRHECATGATALPLRCYLYAPQHPRRHRPPCAGPGMPRQKARSRESRDMGPASAFGDSPGAMNGALPIAPLLLLPALASAVDLTPPRVSWTGIPWSSLSTRNRRAPASYNVHQVGAARLGQAGPTQEVGFFRLGRFASRDFFEVLDHLAKAGAVRRCCSQSCPVTNSEDSAIWPWARYFALRRFRRGGRHARNQRTRDIGPPIRGRGNPTKSERYLTRSHPACAEPHQATLAWQ